MATLWDDSNGDSVFRDSGGVSLWLDSEGNDLWLLSEPAVVEGTCLAVDGFESRARIGLESSLVSRLALEGAHSEDVNTLALDEIESCP
jgi:hypothetical protein